MDNGLKPSVMLIESIIRSIMNVIQRNTEVEKEVHDEYNLY